VGYGLEMNLDSISGKEWGFVLMKATIGRVGIRVDLRLWKSKPLKKESK